MKRHPYEGDLINLKELDPSKKPTRQQSPSTPGSRKGQDAAGSPEAVKQQAARKLAQLLGDLRTKAEEKKEAAEEDARMKMEYSGGDGIVPVGAAEIDRNQYYDALTRHGILEDTMNVCFTDAPDAVFEALDTNQNGTLSIEELEAGIKELVNDESSLKKVEDLLSLGNDVMKTSIRQMSIDLSKQANRVVDLFKKWDRDGDGSISKAEFRRAMPMLGLTGHTPQEVDALFATFDPDGSGE